MPTPILIGIHGEGVSTKQCNRCRLWKPLSSFNKQSSNPDQLAYACRSCTKTYRKQWNGANVDKVALHDRRAKLWKKYQITLEQYEEQLAQQGGGCAICGRKECQTGRNLAVDHDHDTKELRGILCIKCNISVGNIDDDPELARKMMEYLS